MTNEQNLTQVSDSMLKKLQKQKWKLWMTGRYYKNYKEYLQDVRPVWNEMRRRTEGGHA